jgi:hypothetical protein
MLLKATLIYRRTGNLRAVQLLLGNTKIESKMWAMPSPTYDVRYFDRFWGQSGHAFLRCTCLLLTQSGHGPDRLFRLPGV